MARMVPEGGWQSRLKPFKTPRVQNRRHLDFVKQLPCLCCLVEGKHFQADDPMHIRSGSRLHGKDPAGAGQKSDDRWVLPGCRPHHDAQHNWPTGELKFWEAHGIDPFLCALVLWGLTGDSYNAMTALCEQASQARASRPLGRT